MHKLYPSKKVLLKTYLIVAIFVVVVIFLIFSSRFAWTYSSENTTTYIIQDIVVFLIGIVISVIGWFLLTSKNYYEVTNSAIIHHKLNSTFTYDFNNVLYIDENYTKKHKTLLFYNNKGKDLFLTLDKDMELLKIFNKECKNLISREEFHKKFPKVKL